MSTTEIDEILDEAVRTGVVPCVSAAVAGPNQVHYRGVFGYSNAEKKTPLQDDAIFRVSSLTKSVTTSALMQLVEKGLVDLDQPASDIFPVFADVQVLDGFDNGVPKLRAPKTPVTVSQLATHSSGLAYDIWSEKIRSFRLWKNEATGITGQRESSPPPLIFDPGAGWAYSPGIDWLGEIVTKLSGIRVDDYIRKHIFEPVGMKDTGFEVEPGQKARIASVHVRRDEGPGFKAIDFNWNQGQPNDQVLSGHGLFSTIDDYTKFLQMFLNDGMAKGGQVLRPETVKLMTQNRIGDVDVGVMRSTNPTLSLDAEFFPGMRKKHSVGFQITTEQWPGMRSAGSLSWAGLLNLFYWWDPKKELGVTFLTQLLPFQDKAVMALFEKFEKAVYRSIN